MIQERIKSVILPSIIDALKRLLPFSVGAINMGGNFTIIGKYDPFSFNNIQYIGNESSLVKISNGKNPEELSISSTVLAGEAYGEYDYIHLHVTEHKLLSEDPFSIQKRLLLKNRGILMLGLPDDLLVESIDVYGSLVKDYRDHDPDFPEKDTIINADIDLVLKFNTNQKFFFTWHAKEGKIYLTFYLKENLFSEYIKMTQESWGVLNAYQYKYSIQ